MIHNDRVTVMRYSWIKVPPIYPLPLLFMSTIILYDPPVNDPISLRSSERSDHFNSAGKSSVKDQPNQFDKNDNERVE